MSSEINLRLASLQLLPFRLGEDTKDDGHGLQEHIAWEKNQREHISLPVLDDELLSFYHG